jgi:uncharacterized protein
MPNRLADELSPYLLQHAHNPVNWRPWGEEALEVASREQKPIFLSIGYSSCHWCHVMAHESFENPAIARALNEHFVCIKVDREERPEIDQIYMEAVQMMTGSGGWPLSVFLTPEGEPFFGGTYWPAEPHAGMPGFGQVLAAVADSWQKQRRELTQQGRKIAQLLRDQVPGRVSEAHRSEACPETRALHAPDDSFPERGEILANAEAVLRQSFDPQHGGFAAAPKFPPPLALRWLLRRWRQSGDDELLRMVTTTLDHMAAGGIFDHLGGGFHRYSVDAQWLVPHFEKMLYDNAMLAACYLEAWQATGREEYADVVRQTLDYLLRDMADPLGGFYSSEDADSEGEEGQFYVWTPREIEAVVGPETARLFCRVYDVTEMGNFEGRNILHLSRPLEVEAKMLGHDVDGLRTELARGRQKLFAERQRRVRPGRDDKVLVVWNGLAIDALARAGAALDEPRYTAAAERAAQFMQSNLRGADGRLLHCWRAGQARHNAYLDDYAALGNALVTLGEFSSSFRNSGFGTARAETERSETGVSERDRARDSERDPEVSALTRSVRSTIAPSTMELADEILTRFADSDGGGFFYTPTDHEELIVRKKDVIDSPVPSGNGLAAMLLLRLHAVTGRDDYRAAAEAALRTLLPWMQQMPTGTFQLLSALEELPK